VNIKRSERWVITNKQREVRGQKDRRHRRTGNFERIQIEQKRKE
jgi:hypothetical protein